MSSIPDIVIPSGEGWVSLNSLTGISAGVAIKIQNKGNTYCVLWEGTNQPSSLALSGEVITPLGFGEPSKIIPIGGEEIWVRGLDPDKELSIYLHVQEV